MESLGAGGRKVRRVTVTVTTPALMMDRLNKRMGAYVKDRGLLTQAPWRRVSMHRITSQSSHSIAPLHHGLPMAHDT